MAETAIVTFHTLPVGFVKECVSSGNEAPLGGVTQVLFHGIRVIKVSLQVRDQDRREEEDGEEQIEIEKEAACR